MFLKIIIYLILVLPINALFAQNNSAISNLFEYNCSEPVISHEDNLINFFRNYPKYIDNASTVRLIDYKYAGTVKNRKMARSYVNTNFDAPAFGHSYAASGEGTAGMDLKMKTTLRLTPDPNFDSSVLKNMANNYADEFVKDGYHVYAIKFACESGIYKYYVFINPEDNKVVTQLNIFGFNIPVEHFVNHDNL